MSFSILIMVIALITLFSYWYGQQRSISAAGGIKNIKSMASLPHQFGLLTALYCSLSAIMVLVLWSVFESSIIDALIVDTLPLSIQQLSSSELSLYLNDIKVLASSTIGELGLSTFTSEQLATNSKTNAALYLQKTQNNALWLRSFCVLITAIFSIVIVCRKFHLTFTARAFGERIIKILLFVCSGVAVLVTFGIVMSVLFESVHFFGSVPAHEFLFGTKWSPQIAMRVDQVASSGAFGAVPLFVGTMLITLIAMIIAVPVGLMTAIYLSQYARPKVRQVAKPMLEVLAGIPTVVYGFFAALTVAPFIRDLGEGIGLSVASESALAAGIVMGIMIIPFISSLSDDAINAVPKALKEGSLALGATQSETIKKVLLPAALPGIIGAILLAVSRAIGETMIVVMAAGMAANLTINPLESVTTVTVQIVTLLTGDQEFDSPKTLAAFALGLMLFVSTLILNVIALKVVRKYREQYD